jgi:AraC family transcriptional regulator of adaptative response / DNA-3-methyladenine glycosylase II
VILPDPETCYRAVSGRDPRFDGWFFTAVRTTGIYCRPSCPALTPKRHNVDFYPSAAAAQRCGFRACKRCRPDASPGSPEWDSRGDLAGRALRLINDGVVDREGVTGLANRLGYSERQVNRTLLAEVGAGPLALARAQRAQTARILLETTDLAAADVAFAAGFASIRQFNATMIDVFASTPSALRAGRRTHVPAVPGELELRLAYRAPMDLGASLRFLGRRAIPGVERIDGETFTRVLALPGGPALVELGDGSGYVRCRLRLSDQRDLVAAVARVRGLLDLDSDPMAVDSTLSADTGLASLVRARPGLRSPGSVDGFEMAVRAVVGQQISVSGARTLLGRIAAEHGRSVFEHWLAFPTASAFAEIDPERLPMPRRRAETLIALAGAAASGELSLDPGADREQTRARLLALPGIGPWTADYLAMRALSDPDVLLSSDLGVRKSAEALGIALSDHRPTWAPWRSYATHHLWAAH